MDNMTITALSVSTRIGVHAWEQRITQRLLLDISIPLDFSSCADELNTTIDYESICQQITNYVEANSFQLIETVANNVAVLVKKEFNVSSVTISVSKPHAVKNTGNIRVTATR